MTYFKFYNFNIYLEKKVYKNFLNVYFVQWINKINIILNEFSFCRDSITFFWLNFLIKHILVLLFSLEIIINSFSLSKILWDIYVTLSLNILIKYDSNLLFLFLLTLFILF